MSDTKGPILYVLVIGFHHKKGCQVEFSFPPLVPGSPNECPAGWKYLPTLALPDGSHNFDEDTVFFHLPSLTQPRRTVYGVSCYRQIPVEKLKNKTADITRGTVQKSVCVLSTVPLFGYIQVKMSLITHAYFDEGDFSKVSLLEDTYHHLNSVLLQNDLYAQTYVGLSLRDFILNWKHKAVLLFKLMLLEKRVIFHKSPVHELCSTILCLLSLFPNMIEKGLDRSACVRLSRPMSPMPNFSDDDITPEASPRHQSKDIKIEFVESKKVDNKAVNDNKDIINKEIINNKETNNIKTTSVKETANARKSSKESNKEPINNKEIINNKQSNSKVTDNEQSKITSSTELGVEITESTEEELTKDYDNDKCQISKEQCDENEACPNWVQLAQLKNETCGFPLKIFHQGFLCLPYLSLPYMDLLNDVNVRGYVVGATNVLFKQKRQLFDILVDIDTLKIECQDLELRKHLHLTTEDLRFADYIVKHVSEEKHDVFLDGVGWEGGDEWIRTQFKIYLLCLLRTSMLQDGSKEFEHFNSNFISAWKDTFNYKMWSGIDYPTILEVNPGHPFSGQLSVADMKLRFSHTMQNTEGGRKLNQAMVSTGRAVATTSKAVGGAISQAKGAFSNWWSNLLVSPDPANATIDVLNDASIKSEDTDNETKQIEVTNGFLINEIESNSSERIIDHKPGEVHLV